MVRHVHAVLDDDDHDQLTTEYKPDDYSWAEFLLEAGETFKEHNPELYD